MKFQGERSALCAHLCHFSVICILVAVVLSRHLPLPPPPPLLMEPRKKPSAELAFRRFFFFFKYQFPFVLRQPPIRAEVCRVWRKAGIVFRAPGGKVVHLLFFLIRFPAILQESQRLQLPPSAVNGGPPCLRTYMLIIWQGEKKTKQKQQKKIITITNKSFSSCFHLIL